MRSNYLFKKIITFFIAVFLASALYSETALQHLFIESVSFNTDINHLSVEKSKSLKYFRQHSFWHSWAKSSPTFKYDVLINIKNTPYKNYENLYVISYIPGSYEVFFDDIKIGQNGVLIKSSSANDQYIETEKGLGRKIVTLPHHLLSKGEHKLSFIGCRKLNRIEKRNASIQIVSLDALISTERQTTIIYGSYLIYFLIGVFFITNFFYKKEDLSQLYIGIVCVLFSTYACNKIAYYNFSLNYQSIAFVLDIVFSINYIICAFAHLAVFEILKYNRKLYFALLPAPFIISYFLDDLRSYETLATNFQWLLIVSILSLFLKKKHALKTTLITGVLTVVYSMRLFDMQYFATYSFLALYTFGSFILASYRQHKEKQESELSNTRLNLELIKSKIQPHFVLNSMTSAMEWIESNPDKGIKFLNALSREFEILSDISDQKLIPLATELESCRNYLNVMEYRKKAQYELILNNVDQSKTLPPSIIRNLIENAITHNSYGKKSISLTLEEKQSGKSRIYIFKSPLMLAKRKQQNPENVKEGTGIQYIKARLMESYRNGWKFVHCAEDAQWVTRIEVFDI